MAKKYQCAMCGHEQGLFNFRKMYSCKAPLCPNRLVLCEKCLEAAGSKIPVLFGSPKCPYCKIGEMRDLGMG